MGRRIDVVLLLPAAIVVLEFKVGERLFERSAIDRALISQFAISKQRAIELCSSASLRARPGLAAAMLRSRTKARIT
jgi:hypothetical protein